MFALLNPYGAHTKKKRKRATKKNTWFGNTAGHRAAAKKGWARKRKRHGPKLKAASSLFTPGGGRIFKVAANRPIRFNSFLGINPSTGRAVPASHHTGDRTMAKRRSRRGRSVRFNLGSALSAPRLKGLKGSLSLKNLTGIAPIFAGVVVNGLSTNFFSSKIPYTKKGLGNIALGMVSAGLLGMATTAVTKKKVLGDSAFIGGVVGVLGCTLQTIMHGGGFKAAFGLGGDDYLGNWSNDGLGAFITPQGIANAIPSESTMNQYALPSTNAQFMPQGRMQMPHTPAQGAQARSMADFEGEALGAAMGSHEMGIDL